MDPSPASTSRPGTPAHDDDGRELRGASSGGDPNATLERALSDEFLAKLGHTQASIQRLPPETREPLRKAALRYGSLKLAVVESRAHMVEEIG